MKFYLTDFEQSSVFKFGGEDHAPQLDLEAWEWTLWANSTARYGMDESGREITLRIQCENVWHPKRKVYGPLWTIFIDEKPEGVKPRNKYQTYASPDNDRPITKSGAIAKANQLLKDLGVTNMKIKYGAPRA